jgi:[ribosomal protein S5]-alanine N-acetyltransferase
MFETERLTLRPLYEADYEAWAAGHAQASPNQGLFDGSFLPKERLTEDCFRSLLWSDWQAFEAGWSFNFYAFHKDTGAFIGASQIWGVQRGECQRGTLGFWVLNTYWRQGLGIEMAAATLNYGFYDLGLHRIEAEVLPENEASMILCQKLGMKREGLRRGALRVDGIWRDHAVLAALVSDT